MILNLKFIHTIWNQQSNMQKSRSGYILVVTIITISLITIILTTALYRSIVYQERTAFEIKRQQARLLALGGVDIALSQISFKAQAQKKSKELQEPLEKLWVKQILPVMNRWQNFNISKLDDSLISATIDIFIACENSKIDINFLADSLLENKLEAKNKVKSEKLKSEFKIDFKDIKLFQEKLALEFKVDILDIFKNKQIFSMLPFEDVTELLAFDRLKNLNGKLFVEKNAKFKIVIMDIFTACATKKLNPWFLTNSICQILGFSINEKKEENLDDIIKNFKDNIEWTTEWDSVFGKLYNKDFKTMPKAIVSLLNDKFEAEYFSVVSQGQVGDLKEIVYAVLEKVNKKEPNLITFKIKKIYWI